MSMYTIVSMYGKTISYIKKGDTVYDKTIEYKDRWRLKEVHDTLYKDKIKYEYKEVPVEVEKPLTGIQKMLILLGKDF